MKAKGSRILLPRWEHESIDNNGPQTIAYQSRIEVIIHLGYQLELKQLHVRTDDSNNGEHMDIRNATTTRADESGGTVFSKSPKIKPNGANHETALFRSPL